MSQQARTAKQQGSRVPAALLFLLFCLLAGKTFAQSVQVLGASGASGEAFIAALAKELDPALDVRRSREADTSLVVALNESELAAARQSGLPVLLVLPEQGSLTMGDHEAVLYWAPSWTDQLLLARRIFPSLRRVGILLDEPSDVPRARALREQAERLDIDVQYKVVDPALLIRQVAELAASNDILIAPSGSRFFTRDTLKPMLLAVYRQNRVFIGPSPAVVRAGALASLHVSPEALAAEVAERIQNRLRKGSWGPSSRITRFDVITNPQVARSLGLKLPDIEQLTKQLREEDSISWP